MSTERIEQPRLLQDASSPEETSTETPLTNKCKHHWQVATPDGSPTVEAICEDCHLIKTFPARWRDRWPDARGIKYSQSTDWIFSKPDRLDSQDSMQA